MMNQPRVRPSRMPALAMLSALACAPAAQDPTPEPPGLVEVVARGINLEAPDSVPSGWTTFRFRNESPLIHFVAVERMPEGQGLTSQQAEVAPVFQAGLELLASGDTDAALRRFGDLPAWFGDIVFLGGPGLTSAGHVSEATVYLEPGTYLLECYVKTAGVFHSYSTDPAMVPMVHEITVTGQPSGAAEPAASIQLEVSGAEGIVMTGQPSAGAHTVSVRFGDQQVHENFVGHDVHLVRLEEGTDLAALEAWMDWRAPGGLETPAPAEFLGGLNEMPAGATGYLTVTLEPGRYAWIAEVPGARDKGMFREFIID